MWRFIYHCDIRACARLSLWLTQNRLPRDLPGHDVWESFQETVVRFLSWDLVLNTERDFETMGLNVSPIIETFHRFLFIRGSRFVG